MSLERKIKHKLDDYARIAVTANDYSAQFIAERDALGYIDRQDVEHWEKGEMFKFYIGTKHYLSLKSKFKRLKRNVD